MTLRRAVDLLVLGVAQSLCAVLVAATAYVYGGGRTAFVETVGFTLTGVLVGLSFCAALVGPYALGALLAARLVRGKEEAIDLAAWFVIAGLAGCVAGEIYVLVDDARFASEVAVDPTRAYDRPRPWPYGNSALVYVPGKGSHATD